MANKPYRERGVFGTPEYCTWSHIKRRCFNPSHPKYPRYGGRGIAMCDEWRDSFQAFIDHVGPRPSPLHTLDRIDSDGNYEPGNVRWATAREQQNNRTNNRVVTYKSQSKTISGWSEELGIRSATLRFRLDSGWDLESAFTAPPHSRITSIRKTT